MSAERPERGRTITTVPTIPFLVQRRLTGVQGENGCWADCGIFEASGHESAVRAAIEECKIDGEYRSCVVPDWHIFHPRIERNWTSEIVFG